jgi:hypothetical protein
VLALALVGSWLLLVLARGAPRSDRDWAPDHMLPAHIAIDGGEVVIRGLRDFRYAEGAEPRVAYRDERFDLNDVRRVWFVLAPFAERFRGLAHSFVSFELADGRYVAVSIEARREADEGYGIVGGLLRAYEVTYVVGTEADLIGQRAVRGDTLYLYPSVAAPAQAAELFRDMMTRARDLGERPEFYNTLTNNCVTNLRDHVNRIAPDPLPWGWGILLPGYSDGWALRHGLLDTDLELEGARRRFRADDSARAALGAGEDFSARIREGMRP